MQATLHPVLTPKEGRVGDAFWETVRQGTLLTVTIDDKTVATVLVRSDKENGWLRIHVDFNSTPHTIEVDGRKMTIPSKKYLLNQSEKMHVHQMIEVLIAKQFQDKEYAKYWISEKEGYLFLFYQAAGLVQSNELLPHKLGKTGNYVCWGKPVIDINKKE